jgi:hypothetical protein
MASTDYPRPESQVSLVEVVKAASLELRRLRARHRAVSRRIRDLRIAVGALRELQDRGTRAAENEKSNPAAAIQGWKTIPGQNRDLRRACRIALLETVDAVSYEDIYTRIVRRGSFFLGSAASALPAIVQELNAMAEAGEVHCVQVSGERRWQRISSSHD